MSGILQQMIEICNTVGVITEVHMYDSDFINIEGAAFDGKKFSLTLHIKEGESE